MTEDLSYFFTGTFWSISLAIAYVYWITLSLPRIFECFLLISSVVSFFSCWNSLPTSLPSTYSVINFLTIFIESTTWIPYPLFKPTGFRIQRFWPPTLNDFSSSVLTPKWLRGIVISLIESYSSKSLTVTSLYILSYTISTLFYF